MDRTSEQALEFQKIREAVAHYTTFILGKEASLSLSPLTNRALIEKDLEYVDQFRQMLEEEGNFPINGLYDIRQALAQSRAEGSTLQAVPLYRIAINLEIAKRIRLFLERVKTRFPAVNLVGRRLSDISFIINAVKNAVTNEGSILDSASPELRRIRREIIHKEDSVREVIGKVLERLTKLRISQENIVTIRDGRLIIPIKDEFRHTVKGIVHHQSGSGATLFVEPIEAIEMNNRVEELKAEEQKEIARILAELTSLVREHVEIIEDNMTILASLDIGHAKALFSRAIGGRSPALHDKMDLRLKDARHPLLLLKSTPERPVIPLDLEIGREIKTLVISGPNAGGKTVALKTIGLLAWMVQSGLQVPVHPDSIFPVFSNIYCDIGDQQSIESDLSTFSSHITRIREILDGVQPGSLALIDEIGKGTSPEEGSALAMAILDHFNRMNIITVATTHHNALKMFAEKKEGMANGSMTFDIDKLKPMYQFRPGIPGSSYTFEISRRLSLNDGILTSARKMLGKDTAYVHELMREIEEKAQRQRELTAQASQQQSRLEGLIKLYQLKVDEIDEEAKKQIQQALEEAQQILASSNAMVEKEIRDIRQSQASKETIKKAKTHITEKRKTIRKRLSQVKTEESRDQEALLPGDKVRIMNLKAAGTVLEGSAANRVRIQTGNKVLEIDARNVRKVSAKEDKKITSFDQYTQPNVEDTLDVRGMDAMETCQVLDDYLEEAVAMEYSTVKVIHGKGRGILRRAVAERLKHHNCVHNHRLGEWNEGADGVTIIELKKV